MFKGARAAEYLKKIIFPQYLPEEQTDNLISPTVQNMNGIRSLMDTVSVGLYPSTLLAKSVEAGSNVRVIVNTGHGALRGDIIRFTSGAAIGLEIPILGVPDANTIILASTLPSTVAIADTFFVLKWVTPTYDSSGSLSVVSGPIQYIRDAVDTQVNEDTAAFINDRYLPVKDFGYAVVDQIDTDPLLNANVTNIPDNANPPLLIVASLAAKVLKLRTVDDIGAFMGLYRDAAGTVLACVLPLGGGEIDCKFDAGEDVYIRSMTGAPIAPTSASYIAINFLG